ncbi:MAG: GAF domain-containing protein, partial [Deltaproteobacteria bacterium]|nr:GAF domain-containing protein [Deltaproteobacteria bacterium]
MPADQFFPGGGELAIRMRAFDWSHTTLGDPARWPSNLRVALGICLTSRFPMQVWWGPDLTLLYNDAYVAFLGRTKHPGALGRSGRVVWAEVWDTIGPMIEHVFTTGTASWSEDIPMVFDRELRREEVYVTFSFSPIFDDDRRVAGLFCACTETTEKLISARRLDTLHRLGIESVEASSLAGTCDAIASVLQANPRDVPFATLYLCPEDSLEAKAVAWVGTSAETSSLPAVVSLAEDDPESTWPLARALRERTPIELGDLPAREVQLAAPAWPEAVTQALVVPLRAANVDRPTGILVIGVSPRRPLDAGYRTFIELVTHHAGTAIAAHERMLDSASRRAQDQFLTLLGHELRNPLSPILTTLQVMRMTSPSPEVDLVERQARHLMRLVDDLLDVSRLARGTVELEMQPMELAGIVDRAVELSRELIAQRNQHIVVAVPRRDLRVTIDGERMSQVIANLVSNASKFSDAGSKITVEATAVGDDVRISIRDEGFGIPAEMLDRVFEPFVKQPGSLARPVGGLGLGLSITRSLVELHGGRVEVHSEGRGRGSEFVVVLPRTLGPAIPEVETPPPPPMKAKRSTPNGKRVLIVEDNDDAARSLRTAVEALGYIVELAHDGPVALQAAKA